MAYVEDVAASASASLVDAFSAANQITFGSKQYNYGSGSVSLTTGPVTQEVAPLNEAEAVAATAKDGSSADASLNRNAPTVGGSLTGGGGSLDSLISTLTTGYTPLILGGVAAAALVVTIILIKKRKGGK
jgi:hypothetical protein